MNRRTLLGAGFAAALMRPDLARASSRRLRFVLQAALAVLDPIWTTAYVTRHHALMVFDTLFGVDAAFKAQPQMVGGVEQSADGKIWALTLREGLRFHDGTPVLARDCVASIARWAQRDSFGSALMAATDELSARDDRTMVFRLRRPFPLLPDALGKLGSNICAIMPERLALTAATTQVTEMVGSGPFRFLADERVSGSHVAYERFSDYVPREGGTPEWTAGPKIAHFDRIDWTVMPDSATASAALQNGEVDWLEQPSFDLLPLLRKSRGVVVEQVDPTGYASLMRFNFLHPPFDNPALRRAVLGAVNQSDYMTAVAGEDRTLWKDGVGFFPPGSPMQNDVGMSELRRPRDLGKVRSEIAAAGYKGERIVVMVATDFPVMNALGQVGADMLTRCGFNVDLQATDWGSVVQRRSSRNPAAEGGWSVFFTASSGLEQYFPVSNMALRGNGAEAWAGWPTLPELERLRTAWIEAPDLMSQKRIAQELQAEAFRTVPYVPLGEYLQPTAHSPRLTGLLKSATIFWNAKLED